VQRGRVRHEIVRLGRDHLQSGCVAIRTWSLSTEAGQRRTFSADVVLLADFAESCPQCGQLCSGAYRFWYADSGRWMTVEVDRPTLDAMLDGVARRVGGDLDRLPGFVREWNEARGWAASDARPDGVVIATAQLLETLAQLAAAELSPRGAALVAALHSLIDDAGRAGRPLLAACD
jgi:hypothetical protein